LPYTQLFRPPAKRPALTSNRHTRVISSPRCFITGAMDMSAFSSLRSARVSRLLLAGLIILSAPTQAADLHLQINGSNTIGAELAPRLVEGMLLANDASDIRADLNQTTREHRITAVSVDGHSIEVRIHAHGSGTAFKGLKDGSAQIGA